MNNKFSFRLSKKSRTRLMQANRITITISDFHGSRSFVTNRKLKKWFVIFCLLIFTYCALSTVTSLLLGKEYRKMEALKQENIELALFKQQVEDEQARAQVRFDLDNINQTASTKKTAFLRLLPNGSPIVGQEAQITSDFGMRIHPVNGGNKAHNGTDIRAQIGTPVQTTADGIVVFANTQNGYGKVIKIEHAYGFQTIYAHLDEILVKEGQLITKDSLIAKSGNTGISSGAHLHYEVRYLGQPLDAANFIYWNEQQFDYAFKNEKGIKWAFFINKII
ncbi:M23 family metallopeptidase [Neisseria sp. Ec49-e6-T10]|uniref:M23 family metallopeptidase n=1 Tax=Neisseria sp. Ec49-e6-T10 TaxID=3140744 RepID=UPI003EC06C15